MSYKETRQTICKAINTRIRELESESYSGASIEEMFPLMESARNELTDLVVLELNKLEECITNE